MREGMDHGRGFTAGSLLSEQCGSKGETKPRAERPRIWTPAGAHRQQSVPASDASGTSTQQMPAASPQSALLWDVRGIEERGTKQSGTTGQGSQPHLTRSTVMIIHADDHRSASRGSQ
jgi:hypothetical protein